MLLLALFQGHVLIGHFPPSVFIPKEPFLPTLLLQKILRER